MPAMAFAIELLPEPGAPMNIHAPLRALLAEDVGKVHVIGRHGPLPLLPEGGAIAFRVPDEKVRGVFFLLQDPQDVVQRPDAVNERFIEIHRLQGRPLREDGPLESVLDGEFHHGQGRSSTSPAPAGPAAPRRR